MKFCPSFARWGVAVLGLAFVGACGDDDDPPMQPVNPPATPSGLAAAFTVLDLEVTWTASANADDYVVTVSDDSGNIDDITETVTGTTFSLERVPGGVDWTISVVARGEGGSSDPATLMASSPGLNELFYTNAGFNNLLADPGFAASAFEFGTQTTPPDFTLGAMPAGFTAATIPTAFDGSTLIAPADGRTLVQTNYAGAVAPGTSVADAWYSGWTVWAEDGSDSRATAGANIIDVTADVLVNTTWTSNNVYRLTRPVSVGADCGPTGAAAGCVAVTLTIEPGTTIIGQANVAAGIRGAYLIVARGSRLVADANANEADKTVRPRPENVIVFTSENPPGQRATEDWGGMIINGQAPTNAGAEAEGEGDSGFYGGPDINDDSGIIRGVRIEFAGDDVTPADQLNGLALQGVGAGTTISYLQIHYNRDDGIEPFGGTVSVDHMVLTGVGDDSIDGTDGYRGFMQFVIIQQNGADADQGLEISGNGDDEAASPKSTAVVANVTAIGASESVVTGGIAGAESDNGIQFREGANYRVYNSILVGFGEAGFCIRDAQTIVNAIEKLEGNTDVTQTLAAEGLIMWDNQAAGSSENFAPCGGGSS